MRPVVLVAVPTFLVYLNDCHHLSFNALGASAFVDLQWLFHPMVLWSSLPIEFL